MMEYICYKGGFDQKIINLFGQVFRDSEGADEGTIIAVLVRRFLIATPNYEKKIFVTRDADRILGSVIYSKLTVENSKIDTWILSPAAVATSVQGSGMGQHLINFAHDTLRNEGVHQVVTYGDIKFYSKVVYAPVLEGVIPAPYTLSHPEGWIAQRLDDKPLVPITRKTSCVEALREPELW